MTKPLRFWEVFGTMRHDHRIRSRQHRGPEPGRPARCPEGSGCREDLRGQDHRHGPQQARARPLARSAAPGRRDHRHSSTTASPVPCAIFWISWTRSRRMVRASGHWPRTSTPPRLPVAWCSTSSPPSPSLSGSGFRRGQKKGWKLRGSVGRVAAGPLPYQPRRRLRCGGCATRS